MRAYDVREVEARWRRAWARAGSHRGPRTPRGTTYFIHDSAPFPNGPLHLGHVRTYVLGDVTARYQRLLGKRVLYHTGFDSFGLPIELEAIEQGVSPRALVERSIETMTRQFRRLGISYDWSRVPNTCDPACYRWTQWLFLEMYGAGIVERREATLSYCPRCETTLARLQVQDGRCWRCGRKVETRRLAQWFIATSRYAGRLRDSLDDLAGWSDRAKKMIAGLLDEGLAARGGRGGDWLVSRQRSWGTPIPIVYCDRCDAVPVPRSELPVVLPADLDWASGSGALARCEAFVRTACPACGYPARRETDTLDCFFDDIWCFLQAIALGAKEPGLTRENLQGWLPVDRCQSGLDTFYYFHLYRFLGLFLEERGIVDEPEMIRSFIGNGLVLAGGRKMSKHLGNAVSPQEILDTAGADALRVAILWAAGAQRTVQWKRDLLAKAEAFLDSVYRIIADHGPRGTVDRAAPAAAGPSKAAKALEARTAQAVQRVGRFIEDYRFNAGIEELSNLRRTIERFAARRVPTGRLAASDVPVLERAMRDFLIALSPFAPHLAEECWREMGNEAMVCRVRWPIGSCYMARGK